MIKQTKLAQMGEMIENIAHQWRQPLAQINSAILLADALLEQNNFQDDKVTKKLLEIESLTAYMSKTINDFQDFLNPNKIKETFFLHEAIEKSLLIVKGSLVSHDIELIVNMDKKLSCELYKNELEQVLVILINNARDVLIDRKIKNPKIFINTQKIGTHYIIEVADNAGGIDSDIIEKIFDPYFTTKHKTQGTGLGLYMATMIIESGFDAKLSVDNTSDGASFKIYMKQTPRYFLFL
jgi:C4-dicarboxylate-specific signal transduction histidine kinase